MGETVESILDGIRVCEYGSLAKWEEARNNAWLKKVIDILKGEIK